MSCRSYSPSGKLLKSWGPAQTTADTACPTAVAPVPVTDYTYDDLDRPSRVTENLTTAEGGNRVTDTVYNLDDTVADVKRAVGTAVAQTYATYTYTNNSLVATVKDAKNNLTAYQYDGHDRKLKTLYPNPTTAGTASTTTTKSTASMPTATSPASGSATAKASPWPTTTWTASPAAATPRPARKSASPTTCWAGA